MILYEFKIKFLIFLRKISYLILYIINSFFISIRAKKNMKKIAVQ